MSITGLRYALGFASIFGLTMSPQVFASSIFDMHMDQDMDGREYDAIWRTRSLDKSVAPMRADDPLQEILNLGKRNLQWLDVVNAKRGDGDKLELSTADTQVAYPIDTPRESNRTIIGQNYAALKAALPKPMSDVLFATTNLPDTPPVDDKTFLTAMRRVDMVYQMASRWLLEEPQLDLYATLSRKDVRGFYFLNKEEDLATKLTKWEDQPDGVRNRLTTHLITICHNAGSSKSTCGDDFKKSVETNKNAKVFYDKYIAGAAKLYDSFFAVQNPRSDATYTAKNPNSFLLPFKKPDSQDVENWLKDNIQDEWKLKAFQLTLNFINGGLNTAYVRFVAGATPNVNGLGGSRVTMDANRNIQEYTSRWTIRHEFGHVIGYPDCYIEYYDSDRKVMINYQIDITNLMCSRRGHIQEQHIAALQKAYLKKRP